MLSFRLFCGGEFNFYFKDILPPRRSPVALIQALMITMTWVTENLHLHILCIVNLNQLSPLAQHLNAAYIFY